MDGKKNRRLGEQGCGEKGGAHEEHGVCWNRLTTDASRQPGLWAPVTPATGEARALAQKEALLCPQGRTVIRERLPARPSTGRGGRRGRASSCAVSGAPDTQLRFLRAGAKSARILKSAQAGGIFPGQSKGGLTSHAPCSEGR